MILAVYTPRRWASRSGRERFLLLRVSRVLERRVGKYWQPKSRASVRQRRSREEGRMFCGVSSEWGSGEEVLCAVNPLLGSGEEVLCAVSSRWPRDRRRMESPDGGFSARASRAESIQASRSGWAPRLNFIRLRERVFIPAAMGR